MIKIGMFYLPSSTIPKRFFCTLSSSFRFRSVSTWTFKNVRNCIRFITKKNCQKHAQNCPLLFLVHEFFSIGLPFSNTALASKTRRLAASKEEEKLDLCQVYFLKIEIVFLMYCILYRKASVVFNQLLLYCLWRCIFRFQVVLA